jgi:hypothetical protein
MFLKICKIIIFNTLYIFYRFYALFQLAAVMHNILLLPFPLCLSLSLSHTHTLIFTIGIYFIQHSLHLFLPASFYSIFLVRLLVHLQCRKLPLFIKVHYTFFDKTSVQVKFYKADKFYHVY